MPTKTYRPEEIIAKLREADVVNAIGISGCATERDESDRFPGPFM